MATKIHYNLSTSCVSYDTTADKVQARNIVPICDWTTSSTYTVRVQGVYYNTGSCTNVLIADSSVVLTYDSACAVYTPPGGLFVGTLGGWSARLAIGNPYYIAFSLTATLGGTSYCAFYADIECPQNPPLVLTNAMSCGTGTISGKACAIEVLQKYGVYGTATIT